VSFRFVGKLLLCEGALTNALTSVGLIGELEKAVRPAVREEGDMTESNIFSELPTFPVRTPQAPACLRIGGLVEVTLDLTPDQLAGFTQTGLTEDFSCEEGWVVPDQAWRGVLVGDLLDAVGTDVDAGWIEFAAEDFRFSLPTEEARRAIVALGLNDAPLTREHGGPARLLVPGGACFTSIKWLDRIDVRNEPGPNEAAAVARRRITGAPGGK
jgi:DMSO/TMAO reductase YedYZ molybdopterin-dependent catalytic subunit